ncbi:MAG: gfo/Idh/MocA family oxidoreductase, partial [Candidatus Latescibacteria bacterium]|nr:gfo/Idh/MocA family oxidoreductase [Candidatus Latescibacterota bacterium]
DCIFEMTDGVIYTYRGSWCAEGLNTTWECDWRVIGNGGSALWDGAVDVKAVAVDNSEGFISPGVAIAISPPEEIEFTGHRGLIRDFIDHIKGDGDVPQTVCTDNIKSLAMVHAAIESAETGRKVEIEI